MLNSQILLGLYKDSTLNLMISSPPLSENESLGPLSEAHKKFVLYQRRDYLSTNSFLVKCFRHEKHNFVIICLISSQNYSRARRIFSKVIEECTRAQGVPTMDLYAHLFNHINDRRIQRSLFNHDFRMTRHIRKEKDAQKKEDDLELGFEIDSVAVDGNESVFGFLQKNEPPAKSSKVLNF